MSFHYKDIVPWGRSFDEYLDMFNLSEDDLARDIVGVGDGPASFNTRMHQRGTPIVSVDPNQELSFLCRCFGEILNEFIRPIYDPITAVAIKQEGAVVFPIRTNRCMPIPALVHLLKGGLE